METATKTVTRGIYNRVPTGQRVGNVEQFRYIKIGEKVNTYAFEVIDHNTISINGKAYKIENSSEFAIKVMKTKIKAFGGASGLLKLFTKSNADNDNWETRIIENCKPINLN